MRQWHYWDLVAEAAVISDCPLNTNGVRLLGVVDAPGSVGVAAEKAQTLAELPAMIGKRQRAVIGADPDAMWRYWNNANVARMVLDGSVSARVEAAFLDLLAANQEEYPEFYGEMSAQDFSLFIIRLAEDFSELGLVLEAERIRKRHEITKNSRNGQ